MSSIDTASIKEYSTLLTLAKKGIGRNDYTIIGIATGFFVRKQGELYLVSANHVFTGNDPIRVVRNDAESPDLMMFRYKMDNGVDTFINIYLDSIKKNNPPKSILTYPDILSYKIDLPKSSRIKSIEKFVYNVKFNSNDSLFFWGFPSQSPDPFESVKYYVFHPFPIKYVGTFIRDVARYIVQHRLPQMKGLLALLLLQ